MEIIELNPNDPLLYRFRKKIICDIHNSNEDYLLKDIKYNKSIPEEVWKFSKLKWNNINFNSIFSLIMNDEVISISGIKFYNNFLRVGMNYYTLPEYKIPARSILWKKYGFIYETLLKYNSIDGYFISIYPHNNKLSSWVNALQKKKSFGQMGNTDAFYYLKQLNITKDPIIFNGVQQYIVYELFNNQLNNLINILEDKL